MEEMPKARPEGMVSEGWLLGAATAFSVHTTLTVFPCIHQLRLTIKACCSRVFIQFNLYLPPFPTMHTPFAPLVTSSIRGNLWPPPRVLFNKNSSAIKRSSHLLLMNGKRHSHGSEKYKGFRISVPKQEAKTKYISYCCRKGDPFQSPRVGSCLTLRNELSEGTHMLTEKETLLEKSARTENSRVRESRRTALPSASQPLVFW